MTHTPNGEREAAEVLADLIDLAPRAEELADRLVAAGPKAAHVSASETHEISEFVGLAAKHFRAIALLQSPAADELEAALDVLDRTTSHSAEPGTPEFYRNRRIAERGWQQFTESQSPAAVQQGEAKPASMYGLVGHVDHGKRTLTAALAKMGAAAYTQDDTTRELTPSPASPEVGSGAVGALVGKWLSLEAMKSAAAGSARNNDVRMALCGEAGVYHECADELATTLQSQPSPEVGGLVVTNDMIDSALNAMREEERRVFGETKTPHNGARHEAMRAALTAALAPSRQAGGEAVFNCRRCPVSVESRWLEPDCPECGDPCELDASAAPEIGSAVRNERDLRRAAARVLSLDWSENGNACINAIDGLRNALYTHPAPSAESAGMVPEGFALVPIYPTPGMVLAGTTFHGAEVYEESEARNIYADMIAAAPKAPTATDSEKAL